VFGLNSDISCVPSPSDTDDDDNTDDEEEVIILLSIGFVKLTICYLHQTKILISVCRLLGKTMEATTTMLIQTT
jgi:hypothetical protein